MALMTWTVEQHGTNVSFADNEHKDVFANLNILYDLRTEGGGNPEISEQITVLLDIVAAHFAHEESEMVAKSFMGYERHRVEHQELLDTCIQMQQKIEAGELELTERICQLIKRWFDSHIPEYDRAYAKALNNS
jgi:hemerythrin